MCSLPIGKRDKRYREAQWPQLGNQRAVIYCYRLSSPHNNKFSIGLGGPGACHLHLSREILITTCVRDKRLLMWTAIIGRNFWRALLFMVCVATACPCRMLRTHNFSVDLVNSLLGWTTSPFDHSISCLMGYRRWNRFRSFFFFFLSKKWMSKSIEFHTSEIIHFGNVWSNFILAIATLSLHPSPYFMLGTSELLLLLFWSHDACGSGL